MHHEKHTRLTIVILLIVPLSFAGGCTGAILDAVAAGALDLIQGTVTGVGSTLLFGENPPDNSFNGSTMDATGEDEGGGSHH